VYFEDYWSFSRGLSTTGKVGFANLSVSVTGYNGIMAGLARVSPFESLSIKQDNSVSIK